jgi:hypothetical protein
MPSRTQVTLDPDLDRLAKAKAEAIGISFAEYIRRLIRRDLGDAGDRPTFADLAGIGHSGGSDVTRYKDQYLGEAVAGEL